MMGHVCESANKRKITLTLGPETTTGEQMVPCPGGLQRLEIERERIAACVTAGLRA
jgi:hypothetical protein